MRQKQAPLSPLTQLSINYGLLPAQNKDYLFNFLRKAT